MILINPKLILVVFLILIVDSAFSQQYDLESPDGSILLNVDISDQITYSVSVDGTMVLNPSFISLTVEDHPELSKHARVTNDEIVTVDELLLPQLRVKSAEVRNHYNALTLTFEGDYELTYRAFDDGLAYRFETDLGENLIVVDEEAQFNFAKDSKVYFPRENAFFSHNERLYEYGSLDTLDEDDLCSLPVLIESLANTKLLITESALLNYPGMWLTGGTGSSLKSTFPPFALEVAEDSTRWPDDRSIRVTKPANYIAQTQGTRAFPWRIICVARNDADLITNQLPYLLAEPSRIEDASWIKPGKVAWDWWNFCNIYGVDFKAGINTDTYKHYIDFAAQYGLEYIILDEGWYELRDVLKVVPDIDMKEILRYGKRKDVGIILWVTWSSLDQKLDEALDTYQDWGVKGLKIDFMQRDDQWMVEYYERIAAACAEHELLVDFHGSYKPAGLRRTYPNVLTREGVKGAENNKWADYITPKHNLTIPFIRMVAGPMDYTPGAMVNAQAKNFGIHWNRPMAQGTRAHQVSMYTLYESPLQMLCDNPSNYIKEDETTRYIAQIPTVWDETKVLHAKIGEYLAVARRNGENWYVGAMNNEEPRELVINLDFLPAGKYEAQIFEDGVNADRYASDYKIRNKVVTNRDQLVTNMATGGGWNVILSPKN